MTAIIGIDPRMICPGATRECGLCPSRKPHLQDDGCKFTDEFMGCPACVPFEKKAKRAKRKKLPTTPRGRVRAVVSRLFSQSRERAAALKRDSYTCQAPGCGKKQSKAKGREQAVRVHHLDGGGIDEIVDLIFRRLLCDPDRLVTLCPECHDMEHPELAMRAGKGSSVAFEGVVATEGRGEGEERAGGRKR